MRKTRLTTAALTLGLCIPLGLVGGTAFAGSGPMDFEPIQGSAYDQMTANWAEPLKAPERFSQELVADETILNIYSGATDDLTDMNTVNETGPEAGRYLYRTHELGSNGSVSVVDRKSGEAKVLAQRADWSRLDGLRWTPWGTLLFAEETDGGHLYEAFLDPSDPTTAVRIEERSEVGVLRHEGIEALGDGTAFIIDELNGGSIYKFEPSRRGDLSDGQLYALKLNGLSDAEQKWDDDTINDKVGAFEWVALDMDQVVVDTDAAADAVNATEFGRPEDIEVIGPVLYVNNTSEDRTVAIDLNKNVLTSFVQAGVNLPVENDDAGVMRVRSAAPGQDNDPEPGE